jgi:serine/threonine protein kinase
MQPVEDLTDVLLEGRYRLTRLMGQGGMGQVYEGLHETLDRKVAVKVLLPRYAHEAKFRERFLREAKAASKVRHPNVVQILDFGDTPGGSVYFAMEFLEGCDLQALLRHEGRLSWPRARYFLLQMVSALAAAHERKIIHRDIKPANFFITEDRGRQDLVKVLDFGIAKLAVDPSNQDSSLAQSLTGTGEVFGTAKYMAPEQAYGASDDPRVDVYSLGIVAYEMLTGEVPFTGVSTFHIITRHVNDRPRPPRELVPELPIEVEAVILRALAKMPQDRFLSMEEMEQALLAIPPGPGVPMDVPLVHSQPPPSAVPRLAEAPAWGAVPPSVQPHARQVSDQVTAAVRPSAEPLAASPVPPPRGHATSVMPTRLKMPSSIAAGELAVPPGAPMARVAPVGSSEASGSAWPPRVFAGGSEESGASGATSRLQGAGEAGSATGPLDSRASGTRTAETDPHALLTRPRPALPAQQRGMVLGLLTTLGVGGVMLAGFLALSSNEGDELAAAPPKPAVVEGPETPGPVVVPDPAAGVLPLVAASTGTQPVAAEGPTAALSVAVDPTPTADAPTEPVPTEPKPAASKTKPTTKASTATKPPAPPTDAKVLSRLKASMKKKCGSLGGGSSVAVNLIVSGDGNVINKNGAVTKASAELKACLVLQISAVRFPVGTAGRNFPFTLSW